MMKTMVSRTGHKIVSAMSQKRIAYLDHNPHKTRRQGKRAECHSRNDRADNMGNKRRKQQLPHGRVVVGKNRQTMAVFVMHAMHARIQILVVVHKSMRQIENKSSNLRPCGRNTKIVHVQVAAKVSKKGPRKKQEKKTRRKKHNHKHKRRFNIIRPFVETLVKFVGTKIKSMLGKHALLVKKCKQRHDRHPRGPVHKRNNQPCMSKVGLVDFSKRRNNYKKRSHKIKTESANRQKKAMHHLKTHKSNCFLECHGFWLAASDTIYFVFFAPF